MEKFGANLLARLYVPQPPPTIYIWRSGEPTVRAKAGGNPPDYELVVEAQGGFRDGPGRPSAFSSSPFSIRQSLDVPFWLVVIISLPSGLTRTQVTGSCCTIS